MKPSILHRYLLRGFALRWLALVVLLTVLMTFSQLPTILGRAADREITPDLIVRVLLWMVVANSPVVILLTLLLAIVLTLGRHAADGELVAMRAGGFSPLDMLASVALFALPVVALVAATALYFAPRAFCSAVLARTNAARNLAMAPVHAGEFIPLGGDGVLLVQKIAPDGELQEVFARNRVGGKLAVITARRGHIVADPAHDRLRLVLNDGKYYEGVPGEARFRVIEFREFVRSVALPVVAAQCLRPDARASRELLATRAAADVAELNLRFGYVALALLFAVIGVPLANAPVRSGAYARVPAALGVFALAAFGNVGITNWSAREPVTGTLTYWSLQFTALSIACLWLARQQRSVR